MADAVDTRLKRSIYLDALRAVALVRVVIFHATGSWLVTAFTAMPLMFFIAGTLYAASLDRRATSKVVRDRYRRIMVPYWGYLAAMVALWGALGVLGEITPANWVGFLMPVVSMAGPKGPGADTALHLTWFALWYIQTHLILSLIGGPLRRWQQQRPRRLWTAIGALFVLGAAGAPGLSIMMFYVACWVLGYAHHDGRVEAWLRPRWKRVCWLLGPVGAVAFFGFHQRAIVVAAFGVAFLGIFWLSLALGLQPRIEPWLEGRFQRSVTSWFSQRSLTIYLWHGVALWVMVELDLPGALVTRLVGCAVPSWPRSWSSAGWRTSRRGARPSCGHGSPRPGRRARPVGSAPRSSTCGPATGPGCRRLSRRAAVRPTRPATPRVAVPCER